MKVRCGDANPNGNIAFTYKGGCRKELDIREAYRCTGCGGWFHKDCILEHFKQEKDHDWGRKEERERIKKIILDKEMTMEAAYRSHSEAGAGYTIGVNYLIKELINEIG